MLFELVEQPFGQLCLRCFVGELLAEQFLRDGYGEQCDLPSCILKNRLALGHSLLSGGSDDALSFGVGFSFGLLHDPFTGFGGILQDFALTGLGGFPQRFAFGTDPVEFAFRLFCGVER